MLKQVGKLRNEASARKKGVKVHDFSSLPLDILDCCVVWFYNVVFDKVLLEIITLNDLK
jgi:hypothetical protein